MNRCLESCKRMLVVVSLLLAGAIDAAAVTMPALTFEGGSPLAVNFNQTVGWRFNVSQAVTVSGLEWFDDFGDGLDTEHMVGIWNPGGSLVASAEIPAGTAGSLVGGVWREVAIAPTLLLPGMGYLIGGQNSGDSLDGVMCGGGTCDPMTVHTISRIQFQNAAFAPFGEFQIPSIDTLGAPQGIFGPGLAVVPEPASIALVVLALGAMVAFGRSRRSVNVA